jgi:hypothetical protein
MRLLPVLVLLSAVRPGERLARRQLAGILALLLLWAVLAALLALLVVIWAGK